MAQGCASKSSAHHRTPHHRRHRRMSKRRSISLSVLSATVLGLWAAAWSADIPLSWKYPKTAPPASWVLTLAQTQAGETAITHVILMPLAETICQQLTGA